MVFVLTDTVDLLEAVGISQLPLGVVNTTGMCDQRAAAIDDGVPVYGPADRAYRLTQRAVLTVSTAQVFQGTLQIKYFFYSLFVSLQALFPIRGVPR